MSAVRDTQLRWSLLTQFDSSVHQPMSQKTNRRISPSVTYWFWHATCPSENQMTRFKKLHSWERGNVLDTHLPWIQIGRPSDDVLRTTEATGPGIRFTVLLWRKKRKALERTEYCFYANHHSSQAICLPINSILKLVKETHKKEIWISLDGVS